MRKNIVAKMETAFDGHQRAEVALGRYSKRLAAARARFWSIAGSPPMPRWERALLEKLGSLRKRDTVARQMDALPAFALGVIAAILGVAAVQVAWGLAVGAGVAFAAYVVARLERLVSDRHVAARVDRWRQRSERA